MSFKVSSTQVVDGNRNIVNVGYVQQDGGTPFWLNPKAVTASFTVPDTHNALSIGPITVGDGISVTVSSGAVWTII